MIPKTFRGRFLIGFLACAGALAYALFAQFQQGLQPCNFCILQRIAFAALGTVFLVGGLFAPRASGTRKLLGGFAAVAAITGLGIALRHLWVQLFPPEIPSCAGNMTYLVDTKGTFGMLAKVLTASGDCSNIDWKFLGLTMPAWSAICFLGLGIWALWAAWSRGGRKFTARNL